MYCKILNFCLQNFFQVILKIQKSKKFEIIFQKTEEEDGNKNIMINSMTNIKQKTKSTVYV